MRLLFIALFCPAAFAVGVLAGYVAPNCTGSLGQLYDAGVFIANYATADDSPAPMVETPPKKEPSSLAEPHWTWHTTDGKTYQDVIITKLDPATVSITHAQGTAEIPLENLPPDLQARFHYDPKLAALAQAGKTADTITPMASMVSGKLVDARGQPIPMPSGAIKYYAIYYSARWCPPCHTFTPTLVQWYSEFKPNHPNFELVFVSDDKSAAEMSSYMTEMNMPWPALRYSDPQLPASEGDIRQFAGRGIPDLVLVNASGTVLADSFNGSSYIGPQNVIEFMNNHIGGR